MNFPQNYRSISRSIFVFAIIIGFTILVVQLRDFNRQDKILGTKTTTKFNKSGASQYLISAIEHKNNYLTTKDKSELDAARDSIFTVLEIDPQNSFAIKQLAELNTQDSQEIKKEIERLVKILEVRPDYAAAWVYLEVLYEQIGEDNLSKQAKEKVKILNPDL